MKWGVERGDAGTCGSASRRFYCPTSIRLSDASCLRPLRFDPPTNRRNSRTVFRLNHLVAILQGLRAGGHRWRRY
jgi:hypothetical protein